MKLTIMWTWWCWPCWWRWRGYALAIMWPWSQGRGRFECNNYFPKRNVKKGDGVSCLSFPVCFSFLEFSGSYLMIMDLNDLFGKPQNIILESNKVDSKWVWVLFHSLCLSDSHSTRTIFNLLQLQKQKTCIPWCTKSCTTNQPTNYHF